MPTLTTEPNVKEIVAITPKAQKPSSKRSVVAGSTVHESEDGRTTIHPQVVAKIAGLAVKEVDGVTRLVPFGAGQQVASFAKAVTRAEMKDLGVHVEVGESEAAVDVRIVTEYGASIPSIADGIRRNVANRIESMTGLKVVEVNIDVVDLNFGGEEEEDDAFLDEQQGPRVK